MKTTKERQESIRRYYLGKLTLQAQWALDMLDDLEELESAREMIQYFSYRYSQAQEWLAAHPTKEKHESKTS